ncbi:uncharacterized protein N7483_010145 [Penicillium malachiteum]|uniref:uncharacterized protein n=1 Tax=Penicillium malachiteum TaxID=1324776 RepID=UPI002547432B|nr:uncharacterized protein N7483_010145 [Penicillium malachiteum]KAJ5712964.1 hypothetical protein N7483_010145 [Penicillium malachiteum]
MDPLIHIIDPEGEVTIVLRNSSINKNSFALRTFNTFPLLFGNVRSSQATSGSSEFYSNQLEPRLMERSGEKKNKKKKKKEKKRKASADEPEPAADEPEPAADEPTAADEPAAEKIPAGELTSEAAFEEHFDSFSADSCFRIQVSAKHLMFASPFFKRLLTGGWRESVTYSQKGKVEITAES